MSGGRAPWWYSGDEGTPDGEDTEGRAAGPVADASESLWSASPEDPAGEGPDDSATTMDWTALLSGAARMVDWATSTVMAPHAEHGDPAEHPQCVVCRTILLVGDPASLASRLSPDASGPEDVAPPSAHPVDAASPIVWIPVVEAPSSDAP